MLLAGIVLMHLAKMKCDDVIEHGNWNKYHFAMQTNRLCHSTGACFRATNVFSFIALFANNPFWCLNQKHVSCSRLQKSQPSHVVGYRKSNQGRVFVPFKHVPVCNQKSVTKNMFLVHHENALFTIRWNMVVFIAVFR